MVLVYLQEEIKEFNMENNWKDISEGMEKGIPYEVMQKGGEIKTAAFVQTAFYSGIMEISKNLKGQWVGSNTFLLKVEKFRRLPQ